MKLTQEVVIKLELELSGMRKLRAQLKLGLRLKLEPTWKSKL